MKNFLRAWTFFRMTKTIRSELSVTGSNQGQEKGYLAAVPLVRGRASLKLEGPSSTRMHVPSWEGTREKRQLLTPKLLY